MFCPKCGQPQPDGSTVACSRCGLPLDGLAGLLRTNTVEDAQDQTVLSRRERPTRPWHRRWDVRLIFFSIVILPLIVFLSYRFDSPLPFTIPSLIFLVGLSSTAYSAIFGNEQSQLNGRNPERQLRQPQTNPYLELLVARLNAELAQQDALSPLVIEGLMLEIIAATSRTTEPTLERERPEWLAKVEEFLRINYASPLTLADVATVGGVHPTHLARSFRQYFGCTVGERIRELRVKQSCRLLTATDLPLSEIALVSGFYDQSHFSRCFRQICGVTPTEFRAANPSR